MHRSMATPGNWWQQRFEHWRAQLCAHRARSGRNLLVIPGFDAIIEGFTTKRAGNYRPFFLVDSFLLQDSAKQPVALNTLVLQTVTGLGYDLVEIERSAGGLLRITIDCRWPAADPAVASLITLQDCEKVTRQLQFALEVEAIEYRRLEVSSPGIDRLLRHEQDFERFAGELIDITLKQPLAATPGLAGRKKFRGCLERAEAGGWQIVWRDEPTPKPGARISRKREPAALQALRFEFNELREARLASVVNFKGRGQDRAQPGVMKIDRRSVA